MITFNPEGHTYTDELGIEYTSVTRFINQFVPQFDFEQKSKTYAAKYGLHVENVRADWNQKNKLSTDFGTKIHTLIEDSIKNDVLIPGPYFNVVNEITDIVKKSFKGSFLTEYIVFDEATKIAGTSDLIIENKNTFSIIDFKTNKQIKYTNDFEDKYLLEPIDHLPNSEYFKYSLQLSFYAYFFSKIKNKQVDRLSFFWLKRKDSKDYDNMSKAKWVRYNVPYLREEVLECIGYHGKNMP